jgi:Ca2+-binding EF-hand superfamily protein
MPGATRLLGFSRDIDCAIELAEFSDGRTNALKAADLNSNGVISLSEFRYWKPRVLGSSSPLTNLVHFDRNFDDEVTQREFDDALDKLFYQADRDKGDSVAYGGFV